MSAKNTKCTTGLRYGLVTFAAMTIAGCGGGGGGDGGGAPAPTPPPVVVTPPPPAPETLFVPANAWTDAVPEAADVVTPEEFRRRQVAGELQLVTQTGQQAQVTTHQQHVASERAFLEGQTDLSDDVRALLAQAQGSTNLDVEPMTPLADGRQVALLSLAARIESAAANYRLAHDPANARSSYALSYSLLSSDIQAKLPAPDTLQDAPLERLNEVLGQMNSALDDVVDLDHTHIDPDVPPEVPHAIGIDNDGVCAPKGYVNYIWFPLRSFVSPVKDQGNRGTCWAFAAIGVLESRERVQNDNAVDLSEQFLVNKFKLEWYPTDLYDTGSSADALNGAVSLNQPFMTEAMWTYNRGKGRVDTTGIEGTAAAYKGVCFDDKGVRYEPCSETAHESRQSCTSVLGAEFCAYEKTNFTGPGVKASPTHLIWYSGQAFNLQWYRELLASGVSLMGSFPVYNGFKTANKGVVSDYARQKLNDKNELVDGEYGGHIAQIVGFLSNEQMSFPGAAPSVVGGGGYFIMRNSWGCGGSGSDGGYYYLPADYVSSMFHTLEILDFDSRRTTRWNNEQVAPGASSGLTIDPKGPLGEDLRVPANLAKQFVVSHPLANYVRLTVTSNRDGVLFDGQWLINAPGGGSLFNNTLPVNFQTEGPRTLTIMARYGTQLVIATKDIVVINSPPLMGIHGNGTPQQGENFVVNADVVDINESGAAGICAAMTWSVDAPDSIVSGTGCTRVIRFGATGNREVRVASVDHEGREGSNAETFNVQPPPANPYPRITAFGLYSHDDQLLGGQVVGCQSHRVDDSTVIDLRRLGCKDMGINVPDRARFFLELGIENPDAEALSYDWAYTDYFPSSAFAPRVLTSHSTIPSLDTRVFLFDGLNPGTVSTHNCTIDVRVNAPVAARSKSLRVWSGRCINFDTPPH